jgi:translation initiation factor 1
MARKRPPPVYSTDPDRARRCQRCGNYPCTCPPRRSWSPENQEAHIRRETKGRGGKTVTVVRNLRLTAADLKALGTRLKTMCGSGGTVKDGAIEIQGDHRDKVAEALRGMGYKTKFTGG